MSNVLDHEVIGIEFLGPFTVNSTASDYQTQTIRNLKLPDDLDKSNKPVFLKTVKPETQGLPVKR